MVKINFNFFWNKKTLAASLLSQFNSEFISASIQKLNYLKLKLTLILKSLVILQSLFLLMLRIKSVHLYTHISSCISHAEVSEPASVVPRSLRCIFTPRSAVQRADFIPGVLWRRAIVAQICLCHTSDELLARAPSQRGRITI